MTHYHIAPDGRITGFALDACDRCGRDVRKVNSVPLFGTQDQLDELGLIGPVALLPKVVVEDDGESRCERSDCYFDYFDYVPKVEGVWYD